MSLAILCKCEILISPIFNVLNAKVGSLSISWIIGVGWEVLCENLETFCEPCLSILDGIVESKFLIHAVDNVKSEVSKCIKIVFTKFSHLSRNGQWLVFESRSQIKIQIGKVVFLCIKMIFIVFPFEITVFKALLVLDEQSIVKSV